MRRRRTVGALAAVLALAWAASAHASSIVYLCGFVPFLFTRPSSGAKGQTVARDTTSTGWLRDQVLLPYQVPGEGARADGLCVAPPPGGEGVCARMVAIDPRGRTLSNPAATPDGRSLVAVAEPFVDDPSVIQTFRGAIALYDPATGGLLRDLTSAHADGTPAVSPDGRQVAFTRGEDLYVVAVAGGRAKHLRHGVRYPTWGGASATRR